MTRIQFETLPVEVPGEPWSTAYEQAIAQLFERSARGDEVLPLLYAQRGNDARLARALLEFARLHARPRPDADADAVEAVLELADAALCGNVDKDLCAKVAENLLEEAFERLLADQRFDRYFNCQCASAAARLAAKVSEPDSLRDAVGVIRAAAALARLDSQPPGPLPARAEADRVAAAVHRDAIDRLRSVFDARRSA